MGTKYEKVENESATNQSAQKTAPTGSGNNGQRKVARVLSLIAAVPTFLFAAVCLLVKEFAFFIFFGAVGVLFLFAAKNLKNPPKTPVYRPSADAKTSAPIAPPTQETIQAPVESSAKTSTPALDYAQRRAAVIEHKRDEFSQKLNDIPRVPVVLSEDRAKRANMLYMPEIQYSNITRSTNLQKLFPLVVVDTETTGVKPGGNDIIEISAIKYTEDFTPVSCFTTLCKPRKPIPAEATEVNNITDEMVADAPPFALVASAFSEYIAGCNLVGHNLSFDLRFLYISGVELPPKAKYYDTLDLAQKVLTKYGSRKYNHKIGEYEELEEWDVYDYKLETLCEYYDIYRSDAHRSLSDCYATAQLFENLIEDKTS